VYLHNKVPIKFAHLLERHITEDSSVVYDNVDSAEVIDSSLHNFITMLDGVFVSASNSTSSFDLVNNNVCEMLGSFLVLTLNGATKIINNNFAAALGQQKGVLATKSVTGTCYNCDFPVEANISHLM